VLFDQINLGQVNDKKFMDAGEFSRRPRPVLIAWGRAPDPGTCNQFLLKLVRVPDLID
jgi:hypothetical protein